MSEDEFKPTSLATVFGEADDAPPVDGTEKQVEQTEQADSIEEAKAEEPPKAEPEPKDEHKPDIVRMREALANLKRENEALKAEQKQRPDVFEDQDGAFRHVEEQVSARVLAMSEEMARAQYPDYDEVISRVLAEAENDPTIGQKIRASAHPGLKAYQEGKRLLTMDQIGDPQEFKARTEAELKAKIRAEIEAELKAELNSKLKDTLPDDLTSERNAGSRSGSAWAGPTPLEAVLPR